MALFASFRRFLSNSVILEVFEPVVLELMLAVISFQPMPLATGVFLDCFNIDGLETVIIVVNFAHA